VSFERLSQLEFYPDPEILSNGAVFYTTQVIYDVTETEKTGARKKDVV